ncbi:MAG TPA: GAF and ANTAR domain-containing protein [Solirubrobacterales bacterium]|nr:GAF and ANTAR domain-containing protein [Solirubrobacterales bacterium]
MRTDVESSEQRFVVGGSGIYSEGRAVPIDPDALASSIISLAELSPVKGGLEQALEAVVKETDRMVAVDGAGLMLLTPDDVLRYAAASDQRGRVLEKIQEQVGEGPCVEAFERGEPTVSADVTRDGRWPSFGRLAGQHELIGVLGVPVDLESGAVGTLNVYSTKPHQWEDTEVDAVLAYSRILASVLRIAVDAHLQGRLSEQLQYALDHRVVVEQAKGMLMERQGMDERAAFELLRQTARSGRERVIDVARRIVAGESLERPEAPR